MTSAKIDNDKLIVWSKQVTQPVAVRFSFTNAGVGNLFSKEARPSARAGTDGDDSVERGLPVAPFRTDDWELDTSKIDF